MSSDHRGNRFPTEEAANRLDGGAHGPSVAPFKVSDESIWKDDWPKARRALTDWWNGKGLALSVTSPAGEPWARVDPPPPAASLEARWLDPIHRSRSDRYRLSRTFFGGAAFPNASVDIGPGSLGLFLGCGARLDEATVWYDPIIDDLETHPPLRFDPASEWWKTHVALIEANRALSGGSYLIGFPDLIENLDVLAQLRGSERTLLDLLESPNRVIDRIEEINEAFFACFDALWELLRDPWGGNAFHAFSLWGPGRTAKLQCDFSCMISPEMFRRFVMPCLSKQADRLDYAMYHLDGTQALPQLSNLLDIGSLKAIEWTPQAGLPGGGSAEWYGLYRRILAAGKSVQAVGVLPEEVGPLLDAVGPEGIFIMTHASSEQEARDLLLRFAG